MSNLEELLELLPFAIHDKADTIYYLTLDKARDVYHIGYEDYDTGRNLYSTRDASVTKAAKELLDTITANGFIYK